MPAQFLTEERRLGYGCFTGEPSPADLARYFHLDDADIELLNDKRSDRNKLGFSVQLTALRYLGRFVDDMGTVPVVVLAGLSKQIGITDINCLSGYEGLRQSFRHTSDISRLYGYREITDPHVGFRLTRWLYLQCWTGAERLAILFERATSWLLAHKVLLPGASTLERFVAKLKLRVERYLWQQLGNGVSKAAIKRLEGLLLVGDGERTSWFDQLRTGPATITGPSLVKALERLEKIRALNVPLIQPLTMPAIHISSLARFAARSKAATISALPKERRLAVMLAFVQSIEASAQDDALEVLIGLLREIFGKAETANKTARLRSIRDLDTASVTLAKACGLLLDKDIPDQSVRSRVFATVDRGALEQAIKDTHAIVSPPDNIFYRELSLSHRRLRIFLPMLLRHVHFKAAPAGEHLLEAISYLQKNHHLGKFGEGVPLKIVDKEWARYVIVDAESKTVDPRAYAFCVLDKLRKGLEHRDIFVARSWRFADPLTGLLAGDEWVSARPVVCRALGFDKDAGTVLKGLSLELSQTYGEVLSRLPNNALVRFEGEPGKEELIVSPLDRMDEPQSLIDLRALIAERMPKVDLPDVLLEIAARTGFTDAFSHVGKRPARAAGLDMSLCAVLLGEACNIGMEPLICPGVAALQRDRLAWTSQNYLREETLAEANAVLVAAQNNLTLAKLWGNGDMASADGLRFVVPVKTVHAGANPKYFGTGRGITYYNLVSDQFTGLNAITVPGTLRDSMVLLSVVLGQQTELQPTQIMTDTGAYSDVVFGLFRLLGYRFSPRLADVGGTRFWRMDPAGDYGALNNIARHKINVNLIEQQWDDMLRLAGSLKLGKVSPANIMRSLQTGGGVSKLGQAVAEFGRIDKTIHILNYINDENLRRDTLVQLNKGEGRHSLAREIFHGKRGELRQRYREGQEDQLGSLGLTTNIVVNWNTEYNDAILVQLRKEGYLINDEDVKRLSPLTHAHINMLGRYVFTVPEMVKKGGLRPLDKPKG